MKKISIFLKNNSWVFIVLVVLVAYFGDLYLQKSKKEPTVQPTLAPASSYKSLVPGNATEEEATKIFGDPISRSVDGQIVTIEYKSTNVNRNHVVIVENGKVVLIREIINSNDNKKVSDITNVYGTTDKILYEKFPNSVFNLYVYPENGIAYLGASDGTLKEIWYFEPMAFGSFTNSWGKNYLTAPPSNQNTY